MKCYNLLVRDMSVPEYRKVLTLRLNITMDVFAKSYLIISELFLDELQTECSFNIMLLY